MHSHRIHPEQSTIHSLSAIPSTLADDGAVMGLISILASVEICRGYPKSEYIKMLNSRNGPFAGTNGEMRAQVDSANPVVMKRKVYQSTIRSADCTLLAESPLCNKCKEFGPVLRTTYCRWQGRADKENVSKFTNNRSVV